MHKGGGRWGDLSSIFTLILLLCHCELQICTCMDMRKLSSKISYSLDSMHAEK